MARDKGEGVYKGRQKGRDCLIQDSFIVRDVRFSMARTYSNVFSRVFICKFFFMTLQHLSSGRRIGEKFSKYIINYSPMKIISLDVSIQI